MSAIWLTFIRNEIAGLCNKCDHMTTCVCEWHKLIYLKNNVFIITELCILAPNIRPLRKHRFCLLFTSQWSVCANRLLAIDLVTRWWCRKTMCQIREATHTQIQLWFVHTICFKELVCTWIDWFSSNTQFVTQLLPTCGEIPSIVNLCTRLWCVIAFLCTAFELAVFR